MSNYIKINSNSSLPKYKQIIACIEQGIESKKLKKGDKLPSINTIRNLHSLSRDTVLLAYSELKIRGIVQSITGKGYYVKNENINITQKIFLLFDELNAFKEDLFNSLKDNLGKDVIVDTYFHHFNQNAFNKLIDESIGNYNCYVIMPANLENAFTAIAKLPKDKVFILDQINKNLTSYKAIYQNPEKDIFSRLIDCTLDIKKYSSIVLLFDEKQPLGIKKGVTKFCKMASMPLEIVNSFKDTKPLRGDVFLVPDDRHLVEIIKKIKKHKLRIGIDVGIIAINDTLLKEILEDGITTITTNFVRMGRQLAKIINSNEHIQIENPITLIKRKSL